MRTDFMTFLRHLTKSIPFDKLEAVDLLSNKSCYSVENTSKRHRIKDLIECVGMHFPAIVNSQCDYGPGF